MPRNIDSLVIGAGQAGLAMSRCLAERGIDHEVIERGRIGERWRSQRWPSLRLLTPGWMTRLPGAQLARESDGFLTSADLVKRLQGYASDFAAPVTENCEILAVERMADRFRVATSRGTRIARTVIIATGACDRPRLPFWAGKLSLAIHQVTPGSYLTPDLLPDGGVLVVGASATGVQLAREIRRHGRDVTLAVGRHVRAPLRYRGRDLFDWLDGSGFLAEPRPSGAVNAALLRQPSLQLVGDPTGGDIDLPALAREGIRLVGRVTDAQGLQVQLANDLAEQCRAAEERRHVLLRAIDAHIERAGLRAACDPAAWRAPMEPGAVPKCLDLRAEGITSVLFATGYARHYPWLHLPVTDTCGELIQHGGITPIPGLYALGLPFMRHRASAFIDGVGRDAQALAPIIAAQLGAARPIAV